MHRTKLITGLLLIFVAGALAGSLGTGIYARQRLKEFRMGGPPPPPERKAFLMRRLTDRLDLTDEQRDEIEKIVAASEEKIFAIRKEFIPRIKAITDESFALMKEKLDPDQQEKLERLQERLKRRHARALRRSILRGKSPEAVLRRLEEHLNLTEAQMARVRPVVERSMAERRELFDRMREQEQPDRMFFRHEMYKLERSFEKALAGVLTEKQMQGYREMQKEARHKMRKKRWEGPDG
jgi:hypothetical protein